MTLYIGVDFHPHQQTVAWCDTQSGETASLSLKHNLEQVRQFYQQLPPGIVGIEASSKAVWFEQMLLETDHQLQVGNPVLIRKRATSRHKSDKRDAELILQLLMSEEFPSLWRRSAENNRVLDILKLRQSLVSQRTRAYNRLQAVAHNFGLPKGRIRAKRFQALLKAIKTDEVGQLQREQLFKLIEHLSGQIEELERWLRSKSETDPTAQLLLTQRGVGYLTALALVNTVGEISRFDRPTKQVAAYLGLDPLERESAGKRRKAGISKAGNALTRYLLGQSGQIAARYDQQLKIFYKRLAKRKPKGVAKMATARRLLVKLVIMWRDNITAAEFDRRGRTVSDTRRTQGLQCPPAGLSEETCRHEKIGRVNLDIRDKEILRNNI
jgi:transposase